MPVIIDRRDQLLNACYSETWENVSSLLKTGAQILWKDVGSLTALHYAAMGNNVGVAAKLFEEPSYYGLDINAQGHEGETALHIACDQGYLSLVNLLLLHNADIRIKDKDGDTPLHNACAFGRIAVIDKLLTCQYADINAKNSNGETPLEYACRNDELAAVKTLLDKGADLGVTGPLHNAMEYCSMGVISLILTKNPDVNMPGEEGRRPLHFACFYGREDIVKRLIDHGACVNGGDWYGYTPLFAAAECGHSYIVKQLLKAGGLINPHETYYTTMSEEELNGHCYVLKALCKPGSELSTASRYLDDLCLRKQHDEFFKVFVQNFSDRLAAKGFCSSLISFLASRLW